MGVLVRNMMLSQLFTRLKPQLLINSVRHPSRQEPTYEPLCLKLKQDFFLTSSNALQTIQPRNKIVSRVATDEKIEFPRKPSVVVRFLF